MSTAHAIWFHKMATTTQSFEHQHSLVQLGSIAILEITRCGLFTEFVTAHADHGRAGSFRGTVALERTVHRDARHMHADLSFTRSLAELRFLLVWKKLSTGTELWFRSLNPSCTKQLVVLHSFSLNCVVYRVYQPLPAVPITISFGTTPGCSGWQIIKKRDPQWPLMSNWS